MPSWWIFPSLFLVVAILILIRNTLRLKRQFGKEPTPDDIRKKYPRARTFRISKKRDDSE